MTLQEGKHESYHPTLVTDKRRNTSWSDEISNWVYYLKRLNKFTAVRTLLEYRRIYQNYGNIVFNILRKKYPIEAKMRNGANIVLHNSLESQIRGGRQSGYEYHIVDDIVTIPSFSCTNQLSNLNIFGGITNGDIWGIFVNNIYSQLPVEGKTVIDIGANIADSSIYFALRGAHKVIGIEPFPRNYRLARKNIIQNKLSDQIVVILGACAATDGEVEIDPMYQSTIGSTLRDFEFKNGDKVPLLTLRSILNRHKSGADDSLILKMDCEGCEYETILSADETTLQDFSHIIIEYHYGYKNLEEKLKKSGFSVSRTRTKIYKWESRTVREGYIVAKKEENGSKLSHPV